MKEKNNMRNAGLISMMIEGMIFSVIIINGLYTHDEAGDVKRWRTIAIWTPQNPLYAEANPGAGASGILEVFFINHSASNDYKDVNTSATLEGWCDAHGLGYANADDTEVDIAHSTSFDIVVRVRGNTTHCNNGTAWVDTDLNVTITWSDGSLSDAQPDGQTTEGTAAFNTSTFTFLYVNFFWDNSDNGFTINKGQTSEIASIEFAAYY